MRKLFFMLCVIISILIFPLSICAKDIIYLPEIESWTSQHRQEIPITTVSGNKGFWIERSYRTDRGTKLNEVWISGVGEKNWKQNELETINNDGPFGNGSTYKTIKIYHYIASFEKHPIIGSSLTIKVSPFGTLTLESELASEEELVSASKKILDKQGCQ